MVLGVERTEQSKPAVRRPLALFCLAFSAAVFGAVYLCPPWLDLLLGGVLLGLGLVCVLKRNGRWALLLLGLTAGLWMSWCQIAHVLLLEVRWAGTTVSLTLQVREVPRTTRYGVYLPVNVESEGELEGVTLELWLPQGQGLEPGDVLQGEVSLDTARDPDPDWKYYQLSQGIRLSGRADWVEVSQGELPWDLLPQVWAGQLRAGLERCLPREEAGFLFALTTGNRDLLSEALETELSETGLSHVVAASGLHVHLLFSCLRYLPVGRRWRGVLLLPLLVLFAAIAGFTPSICRAALMEGILLLGPLFDREADGCTSLFFALALLLGQNVFAAASVSLQLSFGAMFGLLVVGPALRRRMKQTRKRGWTRKILGSLIATLGANVLTMPLVLYYFHTASLLMPLSNLVVLWLLPLLLPLALGCGLLGWWVPLLGRLLAVPVGWLTEVVLTVIHTLASFPWRTLPEGPPCLAWVVLCYAVGLILYFGHCSGRQTAWAVVGLFALLPAAFWAGQKWTESWTLTAGLLDVGQGQCLILQSEGETAVIDCGGTGNQGIEKLEQWTAGTRIDALLLTHYDQDHTGDVVQLLLEKKVDALYLPQPLESDVLQAKALHRLAEQLGVSVRSVEEPCTCALGRAQLSLYPLKEPDYRGMAVLVSQGDFDLLVTGDAGEAGEEALLDQAQLSDIEVLVAGHHGAAGSTGEALLEAAAPQLVLFSVGENSYGHPTQEVLDRCQAAGAQLRRTDRNGDIWIHVREPSEQEGKKLDG